jgi:hypothetical protein
MGHIPIRSYRYTVTLFPLPHKKVLKYRTRKKMGGIYFLVFNTNVPPDRAIEGSYMSTSRLHGSVHIV